jgi:hypothetical protein
MLQHEDTVEAEILSEGIELLPPEILIKIFCLCPRNRDISDPAQIAVSSHKCLIENGPWSLSHVCRKWRSICISTPSLWSNIAISGTSDSDEIFEPPPLLLSSDSISLIEEGLTRSKSYDLSISITGEWTDPLMAKPFLPYCSRWKSLSLEITLLDSEAWDDVLAPISGHLPNLSALKLRIAPRHEWGYEDDYLVQILAFQHASHLRYVDIDVNNNIEIDPDTQTRPKVIIKLPWSSLTDLTTISTFGETHPMQFLPLASNLRFLRMESVYFHSGVWDGVICHTGIEALDLDWTEPLRSFTLPSLKMLRTTIVGEPTDVEDIIDFISRSQCELQSLCISMRSKYPEVTREEIVKLLSACPAVTEFTFSGYGMISIETVFSCLIGSAGKESNEEDSNDNTSPIHKASNLTLSPTNTLLLPLLQTLNIHSPPTKFGFVIFDSHGPFFDSNPAVLPWLNTLIASRYPSVMHASSSAGVASRSLGLQRIRLCAIGREIDDHSRLVGIACTRLYAYRNRSGWQLADKEPAGGTSVLFCQSDTWQYSYECLDDCPATRRLGS